MNCLTYLLDLLDKGYSFVILYDGNHCIGVNSNNIYDYEDILKKELLREPEIKLKHFRIEKIHDLDVVNKIFELNKKELKVLEKYYNNCK